MRVKIKALSVNDCRQGKRFKTNEYKEYEKIMLMLLPKIEIPEGELKLILRIGVSSRACDIDNPIKPIFDILSKKYWFNDNRIYELQISKIIVAKWEEFIDIRVGKPWK